MNAGIARVSSKIVNVLLMYCNDIVYYLCEIAWVPAPPSTPAYLQQFTMFSGKS